MHGFIVFRDLCEYVHDGRKFYLEAHGFNPFDVGETLKLSLNREPCLPACDPKKKKKKKKQAGRGDRTPDLPLTKRLPCHLAIPALLFLEGKKKYHPAIDKKATALTASTTTDDKTLG